MSLAPKVTYLGVPPPPKGLVPPHWAPMGPWPLQGPFCLFGVVWSSGGGFSTIEATFCFFGGYLCLSLHYFWGVTAPLLGAAPQQAGCCSGVVYIRVPVVRHTSGFPFSPTSRSLFTVYIRVPFLTRCTSRFPFVPCC